MLTHKPIPLSSPEKSAIDEFLGHKGRPILEKVMKGQIAVAIQESGEEDLSSPMTILADGPQNRTSRDLCVAAARLKIFLEVLEELSRPETEFEFTKFEVE